LGKVFHLPSAAILFLLECSPKVLYGAEGGNGWWVAVFGDVADSFIFKELLGCIGVVGQCQIRPEVVQLGTLETIGFKNGAFESNCSKCFNNLFNIEYIREKCIYV
jgi:hypothetical protein